MLEIDLDKHNENDIEKLISGLIIPRPVVLVTTSSPDGVLNCAPFSFLQVVCWKPPLISLSITSRYSGRKDTLRNILMGNEFVINVARPGHLETIEAASEDYPPEISEVEELNLKTAESSKVSVAGLAGFPVRLECELRDQLSVANGRANIIFGEVMTAHLEKEILNGDKKPRPEKINPLIRTGQDLYSHLGKTIEPS
jgi:flavin reductase (DIM6/NTAB) family NADH-FMN oxidoreductase RutF